MATVVVLSADLLFASNVLGALRAGGHEVQLVSDAGAARVQVPDADVFVVDLTGDEFDGSTLLESMAMGRELGDTRTLAFYSHVDADARRRALKAGFDQVVPRSRMAREGAALVTQLADAGRAS